MPTLVPSYNTKRMYATWVRQGGMEMRPGTYKVTVPVRVTNATDDVIIPAGVFSTGDLNIIPGTGPVTNPSLDIFVPCTDDPDNLPPDWQLHVEINFPDAPPEKYVVDVPIAGPDINLRTVVLVQVLPIPQPSLVRGVPGGVAGLDADGDVINAAGEKIEGGGGMPIDADLDDVADSATRLAMTPAERTAIPLKAADTTVVHNSGDETVNGVKTFGSIPLLPGTDPTVANQATRKAWVDAQISAAVNGIINGAPGALDALNELAAAMGNDPNFATTVTNALAAKAPLASPAFTGNPTAPTPTAGDNDTSVATTAFVTAAVAPKAPLASPAFTGNPTAPTPADADNDTTLATTAYVKSVTAPSADPNNLLELGSDGKPLIDGANIQPAGSYLEINDLEYVPHVHVLEAGQTAANVPIGFPVSSGTRFSLVFRKQA